MKYSATAWPWFSSFLLKPFVSRVKRRIPIPLKVQATDMEIANALIVIAGSRATTVFQQLQHGLLSDSGHSARRIYRNPFYKCGDYRNAFVSR